MNSSRVFRVPNRIDHTLTLEPEQTFNINRVYLVRMNETSVNRTRVSALHDTRYSMRLAPDGRALALSTNGRAWTLFELAWVDSPMERPFWCTHRTVRTLDPWPSSRLVVLEVLAETSPNFAGVRVHTTRERRPLVSNVAGAVPADGQNDEFRGAMLYACAHRDDSILRAALLEAYVQPGIGSLSVPGDDSILAKCIGDLARSDPTVMHALESALPRLRPVPPARSLVDVARVEAALYQAGVPRHL
jgi:hypothetical protein